MSLLDAAGIMNGGIWANEAFDFDSPLKDLLDTGNYTLEQILAEDELLQELRGMNVQLIDFFSKEETVAGLLQYIILPPSASTTMRKAATVGQDGEGNGEETEPKLQKDSIEAANGALIGKDEKEPGNWLHGEDPVDDDNDFNPTTRQPRKTQQELNDDLHIRFPYMACEVICCELKGIVNIIVDGFVPLLDHDDDDDESQKNDSPYTSASKLVSDEARGKPMLDLLFSMLYESDYGEIDDYRAGYLEKILSVLLRHRPNDIAEYFNEGGGKGNEVLMSAMFRHLYSHSLMQIVQRLLLPATPAIPGPENGDLNDANKDETMNECEDLFNDTMEATEMDGMDSFRCNWSESEKGLELILDCLIGDGNTGQRKGEKKRDLEEEEERRFNLYQNSSEVLITVIQNSLLTSTTMITLTSDPVLDKLIRAATFVKEEGEFSRHESRLTCAMSVLESLILQLGGYGSVGTFLHEEDDEGDDQLLEAVRSPIVPEGMPSTEDRPQPTMASTEPSSSTLYRKQKFATTETLIRHLPKLLSSLSNFLVDPVTDHWVSPMQFSKTQPQQILGASRLRIVRLLESLVLLGNPLIDSLLCESSCLEVCLDLFWKFQWCSMLHQSVANLLVHVFEGQNARAELQIYFLVRCNLLGRLMYSFYNKQVDGGQNVNDSFTTEMSESILGQKDSDSDQSPTISSVDSENGKSPEVGDLLPVSDDDVDVAIEQQQEQGGVSITGFGEDSTATESKGTNIRNGSEDVSASWEGKIHKPKFRFGFIGHVIVICQALVQAVTKDIDGEITGMEAVTDDFSPAVMSNGSQVRMNENAERTAHGNEELDADDSVSIVLDNDVDETNDCQSEPLILLHIVKEHHLGKIWEDFVSTTLNAETSKQATPLGGYQASTLGSDPLHMHRPGLEDVGGYDDDDGEAPALPPRGLLVDGDVIDMDDNDLEVAANMMAGLNLAGHVSDGNDGHQASSHSSQNGYVFDDPLGGGRFGDFDDVNGVTDDGSDSSSDEEPDMLASTQTNSSGSGDNEAPVMDLFAGNFDAFGDSGVEGFSDFANFDDAFADAQNVNDHADKEEKNNFDSIFGDVKSHDILLDDVENPVADNEAMFDDPVTMNGDVSTS